MVGNGGWNGNIDRNALATGLRRGYAAASTDSAVAAALWAAVPVTAGFLFRKEVERLLDYIETMGAGALAIVGTIVVIYVVVKAIQRYMLLRFLRMIRISPAELRGLIERLNLRK